MLNTVVLSKVGDYIRETISKNLIPDWISFTVQFAALIIMVTVIIFVAYKPVKKMLAKRADYVENNIRESETAKAIALQNASASEETLIASKKEAAEIIAAAKEKAVVVSKETIEQAQLEVNRMKAQAEEDIAQSKIEAREEVRKEMVSVALAASEEVLKREINEKDNARVVEDFIKDLDN